MEIFVKRSREKEKKSSRRKFIYFGFLLEYSDIKKADNLCYRLHSRQKLD